MVYSRSYEVETDDIAMCSKCKEWCGIVYQLEQESDDEIDRFSNCCGMPLIYDHN